MNSHDMSFYRGKYREFMEENPELQKEVTWIQNSRDLIKEADFQSLTLEKKSEDAKKVEIEGMSLMQFVFGACKGLNIVLEPFTCELFYSYKSNFF